MTTTIRPAVSTDSTFIWRLSQDPSVREMSTRSDAFSFEESDRWFKGKLSDGLNAIWIMEEDGAEAGQVRYGKQCDKAGHNRGNCAGGAEIAISISPLHRGRGLAHELLTYTMPLACEWLGVSRLVALVLRANVPSQKLFLRAGFKYMGHEERMGKDHLRYEWEKT